MRTSLRRIVMAAAAVIAVGTATVALPGAAEAADGMVAGAAMAVGVGSVGASRLVSRSASERPITAATTAARITPTGATASCAAAG